MGIHLRDEPKLFTLLFTVCALFLFVESQAQLAVRAGLNVSSLTYEVEGLSLELSSKIAFNAGLQYETAINEKFSFRPAALFSLKGATTPENFFFTSDDEGSLTLSYLEVPLDFVFKIDAGANKVGFHAGPYVGMLLAASSSEDGDDDLKDSYKSADFGLNLGATYELPKFSIGLNFSSSIGNIADLEEGDEGSVKNSNFSVFGAYKF